MVADLAWLVGVFLENACEGDRIFAFFVERSRPFTWIVLNLAVGDWSWILLDGDWS